MFYFNYPPICTFYQLNTSIFEERMNAENIIYTGAPVNAKTSIFNLRYLNHFYMDFYTTKMSRSTVKQPF